MSAISPIETTRLRLVAMSTAVLRLMMQGRFDEAARVCGFAVPENCSLGGQSWVGNRIRMIEEDASQHPWMNRAIVRREDNQMIGNISFHHKAPDPHLFDYAPLAAELGYTIEAPYRRRGYARESALAMMKWAHREHGVSTFILSISPENQPSLRMAEAMGFYRVGQHFDEIDGLEWVMGARIEEVTGA